MSAYAAFIPPDTRLYSGDYTTSPSGVYYGLFVVTPATSNQPSSYQFWVVPGSSPAVSGCCFGYTPTNIVSDTNLGGFFAHMQTDGNFVVYTSATGRDEGTVIPVAATSSQQPITGAYIAQVGDDDSFTISAGTSPGAGPPVFSVTGKGHGPVTGIELKSITYDYSNATFLSKTGVGWYSADFPNTTDTPVQVVAQQNISYTQTASFSFSVADAVSEGISANVTWGIPGIAKDSLGFQITNTTTITHGRADSKSSTVTFIAGARPEVPAGETYNVTITGTSASYSIPYVWSGVATYSDGTMADVTGTGVFDGASQGNFLVTTTCVSPPSCAPGSVTYPALITAVPEPAAAASLAFGLVLLALWSRYRRER